MRSLILFSLIVTKVNNNKATRTTPTKTRPRLITIVSQPIKLVVVVVIVVFVVVPVVVVSAVIVFVDFVVGIIVGPRNLNLKYGHPQSTRRKCTTGQEFGT